MSNSDLGVSKGLKPHSYDDNFSKSFCFFDSSKGIPKIIKPKTQANIKNNKIVK
jgi:hypothetical protein